MRIHAQQHTLTPYPKHTHTHTRPSFSQHTHLHGTPSNHSHIWTHLRLIKTIEDREKIRKKTNADL